MQGSPTVIAILNRLLTGELTAADQYFAHSRMYEDWGLSKLYERIEHERQDEVEHAAALVKRILFLEGTPDLASRFPMMLGTDVPSMLQSDLDVEISVVAALKDAIAQCEQERDFETRRILVGLLEDTEVDHAHWLEQQLRLIKLMGLPNYLQSAAS